MKTSTTAGLLSAFVFPGAGHLYMKHFVTGIGLAGGAAWALYYMVSQLMSTALEIAQELQQRGENPDLDTLVKLVAEQSQAAHSTSISFASMALLVIWAVGIADAYRLGRLKDKNQSAATN